MKNRHFFSFVLGISSRKNDNKIRNTQHKYEGIGGREQYSRNRRSERERERGGGEGREGRDEGRKRLKKDNGLTHVLHHHRTIKISLDLL